MGKTYWAYMMTNKNRTTVYIGMTNNLESRVDQHRAGEVEGFTKHYNLTYLVHYEAFTKVHDAIRREKQLKRWDRAWKNELIETDNPNWDDLSDGGNWFK